MSSNPTSGAEAGQPVEPRPAGEEPRIVKRLDEFLRPHKHWCKGPGSDSLPGCPCGREQLRDEVRALASQAQAEAKWQPIETAPKERG